MTSKRLLNPIAKTMLDAADYIEKHGHCKHTLYGSNGSVCLFGAIDMAMGGPRYLNHVEAANAVKIYLQLEVPEIVQKAYGDLAARSVVVSWNNHPDRTAEEVTAALRGAALTINTD